MLLTSKVARSSYILQRLPFRWQKHFCCSSSAETHMLAVKSQEPLHDLSFSIHSTVGGTLESSVDGTTIEFKSDSMGKNSVAVADWFRDKCEGGQSASIMSSDAFTEWPVSLHFACHGYLEFKAQGCCFFRGLVIGLGTHPQHASPVWWIGTSSDTMGSFVDSRNPGTFWMVFACNSTPTPFGNMGFKFDPVNPGNIVIESINRF